MKEFYITCEGMNYILIFKMFLFCYLHNTRENKAEAKNYSSYLHLYL